MPTINRFYVACLVAMGALFACSLTKISDNLVSENTHPQVKTLSPSPQPSIMPSVAPTPLLEISASPALPCWPLGAPLPSFPPIPDLNIPAEDLGFALPLCTPSPMPPISEPPKRIVVVAGAKETGYVDGNIQVARFNRVTGFIIDDMHIMYITDANNMRIRKITPDGMVSTLAGSGSLKPDQLGVLPGGFEDGPGDKAKFRSPSKIVTDKQGNLYVVDAGNRRIRKITPNGNVSTFAGSSPVEQLDYLGFVEGEYEDGPRNKAKFNEPRAMTIDREDNLYVIDIKHLAYIRKITPDGTVSTLKDENGKPIDVSGTIGITFDSQGNFYTPDSSDHRITKITPDGTKTHIGKITRIDEFPIAPDNNNLPKDGCPPNSTCSGGYQDGSIEEALFNNPSSIAIDQHDNIYVSDSRNDVIRKITPDGMVSTVAVICEPGNLAVDPYGNVYVTQFNRILKLVFSEHKGSADLGIPYQPSQCNLF